MTIMYNETLLKSIVKNNFSLWYIWIFAKSAIWAVYAEFITVFLPKNVKNGQKT